MIVIKKTYVEEYRDMYIRKTCFEKKHFNMFLR